MIVPLLMALTFATLLIFFGLCVITARFLAAGGPHRDGACSTDESAGRPSRARRSRGAASVR